LSQPPLFLSLIIPAYNEENRLPETLTRILAYLERQPYSAEVLVVENGSSDRTLAVARQFANQNNAVRILQSPLRGKGVAVQQGMLAAAGQYRFMCDADLSMPIEQLDRFLPPARPDFDVLIASREAPGAVRYGEPTYRHLVGRVFNWVIHLLALPGLQDTQCGFKCFRDAVAEQVFSHQTITGWAFDVEALFIARYKGYRIQEVPIDWYFNADSKINVARDSLRMFVDLLRIRWNALAGKYGPHASR
jgi:glycosyltransferase involved in cell wall biosynthesis